MTDMYIYILFRYVVGTSVQSKMEDRELEAVVGALGFWGFFASF